MAGRCCPWPEDYEPHAFTRNNPPNQLPRQPVTLLCAQLAGQHQLQIRAGAAIGLFVGVDRHSERMRSDLSELRHIGGEPKIHAISRKVLRQMICKETLCRARQGMFLTLFSAELLLGPQFSQRSPKKTSFCF